MAGGFFAKRNPLKALILCKLNLASGAEGAQSTDPRELRAQPVAYLIVGLNNGSFLGFRGPANGISRVGIASPRAAISQGKQIR